MSTGDRAAPRHVAANEVRGAVEWATSEADEIGRAAAQDSEAEAGRDGASPTVVRYSRRLSDKILVAFHHACDQSDLEIADSLIRTLEALVTRRTPTPDAGRRRSIESLVAAHERLWHLKHKDPTPG